MIPKIAVQGQHQDHVGAGKHKLGAEPLAQTVYVPVTFSTRLR